MSKTLSPKLAQKEKRNAEILKEFKDRKEAGDMTMGIVEDILQRFKTMNAKMSAATILRIVRNENKNENKFASK